jgi:hypothetical protein
MTNNTTPDDLLSMSEIADALGMSVNTLRVARQRGAFPAVKRHGLWLARIEDVQAYNERAATKGANPRIADLERENAELAARVAELERRFAGDDATA